MTNDLSDLDKKIQNAMRDQGPSDDEEQRAKDAQNMSNGMKAGVELTCSIGAGGLIGYGLDQWLGTNPWLMIVMLLVGILSGFANVYKTTQNIGTSIGYSQLHQREKDARTSPEDKESSNNTD